MYNPPPIGIDWFYALQAWLPHIVVIAVVLFAPILVIYTEGHRDKSPNNVG
jgi:hypothetical protein